MHVHIFTTDISALDLILLLPQHDKATCILTPSNRAETRKIRELKKATDLPVRVHRRGHRLDSDFPPADVAICWLYSQIINAEDLGLYSSGLLNMHGGKIPSYRGANVLQWAIINGERDLGITWHQLVAEVDAGPIWAESSIPIPAMATAADMRRAMIAEGLRLFPDAWKAFRDKTGHPRQPDLSQGRVWPPRQPDDGRLVPGQPERFVRNMVRALCPPWPPATIWHDGAWHTIEKIADGPAPSTVPYECAERTLLYLKLGPRP